jgi:hypothetical protein
MPWQLWRYQPHRVGRRDAGERVRPASARPFRIRFLESIQASLIKQIRAPQLNYRRGQHTAVAPTRDGNIAIPRLTRVSGTSSRLRRC